MNSLNQKNFNEVSENLNIKSNVTVVDFAKLSENYLKSGDAFTVHALGVRDFAK